METFKHRIDYLLKIVLVCLSCFIAYDLISTNFLKLPTFIMVLLTVVFAFIVSFALNRPVGIFDIFRKKTEKEKFVRTTREFRMDESKNSKYGDNNAFENIDSPVITATPAPRSELFIMKLVGHIINAIVCNALLLIAIILITR